MDTAKLFELLGRLTAEAHILREALTKAEARNRELEARLAAAETEPADEAGARH